MIKVLSSGKEEKVVVEGSTGTTVSLEEEGVHDLDGYWMYDVKVAYYIDFNCCELQKVYLHHYEQSDVEIDCSNELYEKWFNEVRKPSLIKQMLDKHHAECERVGKGKFIKVIKGRKVPIGAKGEVFWIGQVNYDPYRRFYNATTRIGFKGEDGATYWTDANNVIVENPMMYYEDEKLIENFNELVRQGRIQ